FERAFADEVIALLDALLRGLDGFVQPRVFERLALLHAEALHEARHAFGGAEVAHEVVLEAHVETREAGIALARAAAAKLAVNAPRLVALGREDLEAAEFGDAGAEFDVRAAARHVCGNGDRALLPRARDDFRLLLVIARVENGVRNLRAL